jgi:crotonobetaine/carnitine-CoA ligase
VIGVAAEIEQEVMAVIVPRGDLQPEELIGFLAGRLPYFAVPRYLRFVERIERTAALRPDKNLLREQGVTGDTFDREAAGIRLRRERL